MSRTLLSSLLVFALAAVVLLGCGGGGGGGGGGGSTSSGSTTGRSSAFSVVQPVGVATGTTVVHDLSNTVVGDVLTLQALVVDRTGVGQLATLTNLTTNAPSTVATLSDTGVLTAVGASGTTYSLSGVYQGVTYTAKLNVYAPSDRVSETGYVRTYTVTPVVGAIVRFYGPSGTTQIASAIVGADGYYQANIPTTATRFTIDTSALTTIYSKQIYYNTFSYGTDTSGNPLYYITSTACTAPLPTTLGGTLSEAVFSAVSTGAIPPAPTGCVGG